MSVVGILFPRLRGVCAFLFGHDCAIEIAIDVILFTKVEQGIITIIRAKSANFGVTSSKIERLFTKKTFHPNVTE